MPFTINQENAPFIKDTRIKPHIRTNMQKILSLHSLVHVILLFNSKNSTLMDLALFLHFIINLADISEIFIKIIQYKSL